MADPKGKGGDSFIKTGDLNTYGVSSPFETAKGVDGFVSPFQDAVITKIPTSGNPTGPLPKP